MEKVAYRVCYDKNDNFLGIEEGEDRNDVELQDKGKEAMWYNVNVLSISDPMTLMTIEHLETNQTTCCRVYYTRAGWKWYPVKCP